MKLISVFSLLLISQIGLGQTLTGPQLLDKAIAYHDPQSKWPTFKGNFTVIMNTPDKPDRQSDIEINLPEEIFKIATSREETNISHVISKETCVITLNGSNNFSEEEKKKHRLTCDRSKLWRNYYTYLYGLPMKLKDPGTIIDPNIQDKEFKGKMYKVLKVTYEQEVGGDTWYFYFDNESYAMEVYQFFKDESANDGEYILLTGEELIVGLVGLTYYLYNNYIF